MKDGGQYLYEILHKTDHIDRIYPDLRDISNDQHKCIFGRKRRKPFVGNGGSGQNGQACEIEGQRFKKETALDILKKRLALNEISLEEYKERKKAIDN